MKIGIVLETKEHEKAWNAFRFATTGRKQGHEVKMFLMGEAVECENLQMVDCVNMVVWADRVVTF